MTDDCSLPPRFPFPASVGPRHFRLAVAAVLVFSLAPAGPGQNPPQGSHGQASGSEMPLTLTFRPGKVTRMHYECYVGGKRILSLEAQEARLARKKIGVFHTAALREIRMADVSLRVLEADGEKTFTGPKAVIDLKSGVMSVSTTSGKVSVRLKELVGDPARALR